MNSLSLTNFKVSVDNGEVLFKICNRVGIRCNIINSKSPSKVKVLYKYPSLQEPLLYLLYSIAQNPKNIQFKYLRTNVEVKPGKFQIRTILEHRKNLFKHPWGDSKL